jgi:D-serine deaminase-like pyridoxal phosphate-dependent protein
VKDIPGHFAMVQSVDSVRVVDALGPRVGMPLDVLMEVNVGEEPQKTGALPKDVLLVAEAIRQYPTLRLRGPTKSRCDPFFASSACSATSSRTAWAGRYRSCRWE